MPRTTGAVLLVLMAACRGYEEPCKVGAEVTALDLPASALGRLVALRDGRTRVTWTTTRPADPDGGAPQAAIPESASSAIVESDGRVTGSRTLSAPPALAARRGSTAPIDVAWIGDGALFAWVEQTITTDPDGKTRSSQRLRAQRMDASSAGPVIDPANVACSECVLTFSMAATDDAVVLVVSQAGGEPKAPRGIRFVRFGATGELETVGVTDGFASATVADAGQDDAGLGQIFRVVATVESRAGDLVLRFGATSYVVTRDLAVVAGPLPALGAASLARAGDELFVAHADAKDPLGGGLLLSRYAANGRALAPPRRVTGATTVTAAAAADDVGYLFTDSDGSYFARSTFDGVKLGADVPIPIGAAQLLRLLDARGQGAYIVTSSVPGRVTRREVRCGR